MTTLEEKLRQIQMKKSIESIETYFAERNISSEEVGNAISAAIESAGNVGETISERLSILKSHLGEELFLNVSSGESLMDVLREYEDDVNKNRVEKIREKLMEMIDKSSGIGEKEISDYIVIFFSIYSAK